MSLPIHRQTDERSESWVGQSRYHASEMPTGIPRFVEVLNTAIKMYNYGIVGKEMKEESVLAGISLQPFCR